MRKLVFTRLFILSLALAAGGLSCGTSSAPPNASGLSSPTPLSSNTAVPNTPLPINGAVSDTRGAANETNGNMPPAVSGNPANTSINQDDPQLSSSGDGLKREVTSIKGEVSDVDGAIRDLGARTVGNEIVVELPSDVLFDFDKYDIRPDAASALEKVLTIINAQKAGGAVRIEGHTDSIATEAYNQTLSERRAASVKSWLASRGVAAARMRTRGFGESRPKAPNAKPDGSDDPQGRQQNRRVEIFISKN